MSEAKKPREWNALVYDNSLFGNIHMTNEKLKELQLDGYEQIKVREVTDEDPRAVDTKLIERSAKMQAYRAIMHWAKGSSADWESYGSAYWYAKQKYENHKAFCDEHMHYWDSAAQTVRIKAGILPSEDQEEKE